MFAHDDDDLELGLTYSSPDKFRADKKLQALKRKLEQQGKDLSAKPLKPTDAGKGLKSLQHQIEGKKDSETERDRKNKEKMAAKYSFGTKTMKQREDAAKLDAGTRLNPDAMVDRGKVADAIKQEQQDEGEVQSEPS